MGLRDLRHNRLIAQGGFFSLGHGSDSLVNSVRIRKLLKLRVGQIVTKLSHGFDFASQARLDFLHGLGNRDVVERGQVITELDEVLTHFRCAVSGYAEASSKRHKDALISHPVGRVKSSNSRYRLSIPLRFVCVLTHSHAEQVCVFCLFARHGNPLDDLCAYSSECGQRNSSFQGKERIRFSSLFIGWRYFFRFLNEPLDFLRECRETLGDFFHLRSQRFNGSRDFLDLCRKLSKVCLVQFIGDFRDSAQLGQSGSDIRLAYTAQLIKRCYKVIDAGEVHILHQLCSSADVDDLVCNTGGNLNSRYALQLA